MNLVVDANVLVGELLRTRGRELLRIPEFRLFAAEKVLDETRYELQRRVILMKKQGRIGEITEGELQSLATGIINNYITLVAPSLYNSLETEARKRIPRDPDDWHTVALALALPAAIWTQDNDFFGCGCPTWTTETLLLQLS